MLEFGIQFGNPPCGMSIGSLISSMEKWINGVGH